jgi:hypothetical protein
MPRIILISTIALGLFGGGYFLAYKNKKVTSSLEFSAFNPNPGKANLPIQIQIKHSEINDDNNQPVEIRAQFSVNQPEDQVIYQWELPETAIILSGEATGTVTSPAEGRHQAGLTVKGLTKTEQARIGFRVQTTMAGQTVFRVGSFVTQPEKTWENYGPDIKKASDLLKSKADENFQE